MSTSDLSILFIDAYDSFTNNIVAQLHRCIPTASISITHIDSDIEQEHGISSTEFIAQFDSIVLGPGPGDPRVPKDIGLFAIALDTAIAHRIPLLGICLGFQTLCLRYGCQITRMPLPCHGQSKILTTTGDDIFDDHFDGNSISMMCYNSLAILATRFGSEDVTRSVSPASSRSAESSINEFAVDDFHSLRLLAWDDEGYAMAVRHQSLPLWGLQFHPESCMSRYGEQIISQWWTCAKPHYETREPKPHISSISTALARPGSKRNARDTSSSPSETSQSVIWSIHRFKNLNSQDLSDLCYESTKHFPVAMLESTARGRYCIYNFTEIDSTVVEYANGHFVRKQNGKTSSQQSTSHEALYMMENMTKERFCKDGCPKIPFWGGWVGFMSYESGLDLLEVNSDNERTVPDFSFVFVERSIVLDQKTGSICVQSIKRNDQDWVLQMKQKLTHMNKMKAKSRPIAMHNGITAILADSKVSLPVKSAYQKAYDECDENLHAGESYELCLTTEAQIDLDHSSPRTSFDLYQNLNKHNPVPFAAYLRLPGLAYPRNGTTILSTSPEQFLSCSRDGTLDMIPMKGTVQRTPTITAEEVSRILQSPKETGENLMIADLIRHDLYSIVGYERMTFHDRRQPRTLPSEEDEDHQPLQIATQKLGKVFARGGISALNINSIQTFETVYQLVSHIRANPPLKLNIDDPQAVMTHNHSALHHVLPAGSMTGAPKKRSCEILQRLEQRNRGVYSGIIGFMDVGGGCSWSVAIRTVFSSDSEDYIIDRAVGAEDVVDVQKRKIWRVGAGGAVTVLSTLEGEWDEMMGKMNNVLKGFSVVKDEFPQWRSGHFLY